MRSIKVATVQWPFSNPTSICVVGAYKLDCIGVAQIIYSMHWADNFRVIYNGVKDRIILLNLTSCTDAVEKLHSLLQTKMSK